MNAYYGAQSPLALAKERLTIPVLAGTLFPEWKSGKSCLSPFRDDHNPSFSVFADDRKWKDFATGEHGDAVDFLAAARSLSPSDAACELIAMAGAGSSGFTPDRPQKRLPRATVAPVKANAQVRPMPDSCRAIWDEGVAHLFANPDLQRQLDQWRAWPSGTVRMLVEDELMATPFLHGRRGIAFPVQSPFRGELDFLSTRTIGFHHRHKPASAKDHAKWSYRPNSSEDEMRIPSLPFILGAGFAPFSHTVIICEGQWDAITLASTSGWLANDTAWPERISIFATRGAEAWKPLIETWMPYLPKSVRIVVFADADKAGDRWKAPGGFVDTLRRRGHHVRLLRSNEGGAKDLNDLHRIEPLTPEMIAEWIGNSKGNET